jgi:hypothetical protein
MYDDATGVFNVCDEGIAKLQQLTGPVSVVTVAGPYRTGTSFLLNRMLKRQDGFTVGGTVKACTRGIWLGGDPVYANGRTYVFMDTEGLGSIDRTRTFETQLFSLALLLSSMFVVNTQGTINEQALQQLELVVQCTKRIRVYNAGGDDDDDDDDSLPTSSSSSSSSSSAAAAAQESEEQLAAHFPAFMWVLRDFALQLADESGRAMSADDYLESALRPQMSASDSPLRGNGNGNGNDYGNGNGGSASFAEVGDKNRIRRVLRTVFSRRGCATLVRPVLSEDDLQHLPSL